MDHIFVLFHNFSHFSGIRETVIIKTKYSYKCTFLYNIFDYCNIVSRQRANFSGVHDMLRAIPFEYTWGGGGGWNAHLLKKSWGEGGQDKKIRVYMKKKSLGGGLKLWAFHPPPHVFLYGIALTSVNLSAIT